MFEFYMMMLLLCMFYCLSKKLMKKKEKRKKTKPTAVKTGWLAEPSFFTQNEPLSYVCLLHSSCFKELLSPLKFNQFTSY